MDEIKSCTLLKMTIHGWKYFATEKPEANRLRRKQLVFHLFCTLATLHLAFCIRQFDPRLKKRLGALNANKLNAAKN